MIDFKSMFNSSKILYDFAKDSQKDDIIEFCQQESEFNMVSSEHLKDFILDSVNFSKSIIALNRDKIVGCILIGYDEEKNNKRYREIIILRVDPSFRGKDIADTLVKKVESSARNNAIDIMLVEVYKQLKTHSFWKKYGYKLFNIYNEHSLEVYVYRKIL